MPAIKPSSHILVTGASGFIAAWVCRSLLERDFRVRGTVRSQEKGDYLSKTFEAYGDRWSYVVVEDLEKVNGFDEAIKGIDGVAHIASPCHMNVTDPYKDLIDPAVNGTLSILKSANGPNGASVKRVVITSSRAAVARPTEDMNPVMTEEHWNEYSPNLIKEKGKEAPAAHAYRAAKTLAEKAAWNFVEEHKPAFDIVTMLPPYVLGPIIHQVKNANSLNASVKSFYDYLTGRSEVDSAKDGMGSVVDVRDLAIAHIEALVVDKAGGNRYIVSKQNLVWQDTLDIIHEKGHGQFWPDATKGEPGSGKFVKKVYYDPAKSIKDLKLQYRPVETTVLDMSSSLKDLSKTW